MWEKNSKRAKLQKSWSGMAGFLFAVRLILLSELKPMVIGFGFCSLIHIYLMKEEFLPNIYTHED
jgi:hypothetical protein